MRGLTERISVPVALRSKSRSDMHEHIISGRNLFRFLAAGRKQEAEVVLNRILATCTDRTRAVLECGILYYVLYHRGSLETLRCAISENRTLPQARRSQLINQIALESCEFETLNNWYRAYTEMKSDELKANLPVVVLAMAFTQQYEPMAEILRESALDENTVRFLGSFMHYMEGKLHQAIETAGDINMKYSECLYNMLGDVQSDEQNSGEVRRLNEYLRLHTNDPVALADFLEKRRIELSKPSTLTQWNLHDYVVSNLLITYANTGRFPEGVSLLSSCDERRLTRCFLARHDLHRLLLAFKIHDQSTRESAIFELRSIFDELIYNGGQGPSVKDSLLGYASILGKYYYESGNLEALDKLNADLESFSSQLGRQWIVNAGHSAFVQENYEKAIYWYEEAVKSTRTNILDLAPAVLANLCVSLILTDANEEAEDLFATVQAAEEGSEDKLHSTVINLVIGYLYCSQENYDFGLERVIEAFGPDLNSLAAETWFYAKTALLSLSDSVVKGAAPILHDSLVQSVFEFLNNVQAYPETIQSTETSRTVQEEAAVLQKVLNKIYLE